MSKRISTLFLLMCILPLAGKATLAQGWERDDKAISTLKEMSEYLAKLESFTITGTALKDDQQDAGLIATSTIDIEIKVARPGSLHVHQTSGARSRDLFLHQGKLSLYEATDSYYATASVPETIEGGMDYALNKLGIELPLMDLIFRDVFSRLTTSTDSLLYLGNGIKVDGVDCHQLAIRTGEIDVQLWVQENESPLPRRIIITSKWEGGAPRFVTRMAWNTEPDFADDTFEFVPPENSNQIQFDLTD